MTYLPANDVRTMCGRHADDVRTTYVIRHLKSPTKSHSRVVRTSSAHRPRIVCTSSARRTHETSVPRLFQVKQQRTALLKTKSMSTNRLKCLSDLTLKKYLIFRCKRVPVVEDSHVSVR